MVAVISADHMGEGDPVLGHLLLKGFLYALTQQEELPQTVLFYNGGAFLTTEGSESWKISVSSRRAAWKFSPAVPA